MKPKYRPTTKNQAPQTTLAAHPLP